MSFKGSPCSTNSTWNPTTDRGEVATDFSETTSLMVVDQRYSFTSSGVHDLTPDGRYAHTCNMLVHWSPPPGYPNFSVPQPGYPEFSVSPSGYPDFSVPPPGYPDFSVPHLGIQNSASPTWVSRIQRCWKQDCACARTTLLHTTVAATVHVAVGNFEGSCLSGMERRSIRCPPFGPTLLLP